MQNPKTTEQDRRTIELWRAMTTLDDYVGFVEPKRQNILKLIRQLERFRNTPQGPKKKSISLMIIATPGSGKNQLVECLAKHAGLQLLSFDISQMTSKGEILDCFGTIVTAASQQVAGGREVLVFFDELNAPIQGHTVFEAFLDPLDKSEYVRFGKTFRMLPCAWLFAGTRRPRESRTDGAIPSKAEDFESRLTVQPLEFKPIDSPEAHLENVYLGAWLIKKELPATKYVTEKVIRVFERMPYTMTPRAILNFVRQFQNVQVGKVHSRNIPRHALISLPAFDIEGWDTTEANRKEGELVDLIL